MNALFTSQVCRPVFGYRCLQYALYRFPIMLIPEEYHLFLGLVSNRDGAVLELSVVQNKLVPSWTFLLLRVSHIVFTFHPLNLFLKLALFLPPFLSF